MTALTKDQILGAVPQLPQEEINVPEFGGSVFLRVMTAKDKDSYEMTMAEAKQKSGFAGLKNYKARLVALCLCDAEGKRLFVKDEDIGALGQCRADVMDRLFQKCQEMNGMLPGAAEQAAKNSESGQSDGLLTA
jgi:hypothetical protein